MKVAIAGLVLLMGLSGCKLRQTETARIGKAADTMVTTSQTKDTTIVTHDTTVKVDTVKKKGKRTVIDSTGKKARAAAPHSDTMPDTARTH